MKDPRRNPEHYFDPTPYQAKGERRMNKQGVKGIEWCDYTWNIVTGCLHGCEYCYARRIAERFKPEGAKKEDLHGVFSSDYSKCEHKVFPHGFAPTFYYNRIDEPRRIKKPSRIFVCSMGDLFGRWVPEEWIQRVLQVVKECPQHTFFFLTKNPSRYFKFEFPQNCWIGATTGDKLDDKTIINPDGKTFIVSNVHSVSDTMRLFPRSFLSFEPLRCNAAEDLNLDGIGWVIIGAQTGPGAILPRREWIQNIIDEAREDGVPVFMKSNLKKVWNGELIQEWPK